MGRGERGQMEGMDAGRLNGSAPFKPGNDPRFGDIETNDPTISR